MMGASRGAKFLVPAVCVILCLIFLFKYHDLLIARTNPSLYHISSLSGSQDPIASNTSQSVASDWNPEPAAALKSSTPPPAQTPAILLAEPLLDAIPEKIWYKLGPKGLPDDSKDWIYDCLAKNPTYRHEFLTDTTAEHYVRQHYSSSPDIVNTYLSLAIPMLRADFLRFLILYAEGGLWSDLDVSCEDTPIRNWIPEEYKDKAALVVGLEYDWKFEDDNIIHSQFAAWMVMARPRLPHVAKTIEDIVHGLKHTADSYGVDIGHLTIQMVTPIVDMTGPKRFTRSIVKSLEAQLGKELDDRDIAGLKAPKLLGDVLILPGNSFAANQNLYPKDQGPALVTHHYAGSWKNGDGGEEAD
jgi:mannosyltransferase OCH1-like enzyme